MVDKTITKLNKMLIEITVLPSIKGKAAAVKNIKNTIWFIRSHKHVGKKLRDMLVEEREREIEKIGTGKEYKQADIGWKAPEPLRD